MSYAPINLTQPITKLSWPYPAIADLITVADINNVEADDDGFQLRLPAANNVGTGTTILFNNVGQTDFILQDVNGINLSTPSGNGIVASGEIVSIYLTNNSIVTGEWTVIPFGGGATAITNIGFRSPKSTIDITPAQITAPGGIVDIDVGTGLQSLLTDVQSNGILVVQEFAPLTFAISTLQAGPTNNLIVNNGNGGSTPPNIITVDLVTSLTGINDISVIDGINTPSIIAAGDLALNGVIIDSDTNISNTKSLTTGALTVIEGITTPTVIGSNTDGTLSLNNVIIDGSQNITAVNSLTVKNIVITSDITVLNFATPAIVTTTITGNPQSANGNLTLASQGAGNSTTDLILNTVNIDSKANITNVASLDSMGAITCQTIGTGAVTSPFVNASVITNDVTGGGLVITSNNTGTTQLQLNSVIIDSAANVSNANSLAVIGQITTSTLNSTTSITTPNATITNGITTPMVTGVQETANGNITISSYPNLSSVTNLILNGVNIDSDSNITKAVSITTDTINSTTITSTTLTIGNIAAPLVDGSSSLSLNGVIIDNLQNVSEIDTLTATNITVTDLTVNGNYKNKGVANAWVVFSDNGQATNNITIANSFNVATVVGGQGVYTISFSNLINSSPLYSYAINVTLFRGTETLAPLLAYPTSPITSQQVNIMTVDTLGNLLPVTDGVSVVIFGNE